jgi:magnesium-transporting ATPase (P-type)
VRKLEKDRLLKAIRETIRTLLDTNTSKRISSTRILFRYIFTIFILILILFILVLLLITKYTKS